MVLFKCWESIADSRTVQEIEGAFGKKEEHKEIHLQRDVTYDCTVKISRFTNTIIEPQQQEGSFEKRGKMRPAKRNSNLVKISLFV